MHSNSVVRFVLRPNDLRRRWPAAMLAPVAVGPDHRGATFDDPTTATIDLTTVDLCDCNILADDPAYNLIRTHNAMWMQKFRRTGQNVVMTIRSLVVSPDDCWRWTSKIDMEVNG